VVDHNDVVGLTVGTNNSYNLEIYIYIYIYIYIFIYLIFWT